MHFDKQSRVLAVEDPKFIYFLRNLLWSKFYKEAGFVGIEFRSRYDFALSFAGADRDIAELLKLALLDEGFEVFYDRDEQHRIIGEDVQKYLAPIYRTEARFVIPLLGQEYPQRVWAKFESEQFKSRFGEGSVLPIVFAGTPPGIFDPIGSIGYLSIDRARDIEPQIESTVAELSKKVAEQRELEDQVTREREVVPAEEEQ